MPRLSLMLRADRVHAAIAWPRRIIVPLRLRAPFPPADRLHPGFLHAIDRQRPDQCFGAALPQRQVVFGATTLVGVTLCFDGHHRHRCQVLAGLHDDADIPPLDPVVVETEVDASIFREETARIKVHGHCTSGRGLQPNRHWPGSKHGLRGDGGCRSDLHAAAASEEGGDCRPLRCDKKHARTHVPISESGAGSRHECTPSHMDHERTLSALNLYKYIYRDT